MSSDESDLQLWDPDPPSTVTPHPARIYDFWLGGKDNFAQDREVGARVAEIAPWAVTGARANRAFLTRAVRYLARSGIAQFLDIGAGLPTAGNVHEIAQQVNPKARVVYVDNDPIVLCHARALLATDEYTVAVGGDARDPAGILADPAVRAHLDFDRPVGVLFVAVLHFVREEEDPARIVAIFRDALAPGSRVVISHVGDLPDDGGPVRASATLEAVDLYGKLAAPFTLRTREQVTALFDGWELEPPGVVPAHLWRPTRAPRKPITPVLAGLGRLM